MSLDVIQASPEVVMLAAGSSHTDISAERTLRAFGLKKDVLLPLEAFGFLVHSSGEWQLETGLRNEILARVGPRNSLWVEANSHYLEYANSSQEGVPAYLATGPGRAYHSTEIDPAYGAPLYRTVGDSESVAASLEGLRLAVEQESRGLIPRDSMDLLFLRAMTFYRTNRQSEAIGLFRKFIEADDGSREVAIAQHLVAHWDCGRGSTDGSNNPNELFRRSLSIGWNLHDEQHQAHVKHSMALCMAKQGSPDKKKIIKLLESSLQLLAEHDELWGRAKVLHTLGQVLSEVPGEQSRARSCLEESLSIGQSLGYRNHIQSVERSLVKLRETSFGKARRGRQTRGGASRRNRSN